MLSNVNLTSSVQDPSKRATQPSSTEPNVSTATKLDDEYCQLCLKLESLHKQEEAAANCGNHDLAAIIRVFAIPSVEKKIKKLREQQYEEKKKEKQATNAPQVKKDRRTAYHTQVEKESEYDEDEGEGESI